MFSNKNLGMPIFSDKSNNQKRIVGGIIGCLLMWLMGWFFISAAPVMIVPIFIRPIWLRSSSIFSIFDKDYFKLVSEWINTVKSLNNTVNIIVTICNVCFFVSIIAGIVLLIYIPVYLKINRNGRIAVYNWGIEGVGATGFGKLTPFKFTYDKIDYIPLKVGGGDTVKLNSSEGKYTYYASNKFNAGQLCDVIQEHSAKWTGKSENMNIIDNEAEENIDDKSEEDKELTIDEIIAKIEKSSMGDISKNY